MFFREWFYKSKILLDRDFGRIATVTWLIAYRIFGFFFSLFFVVVDAGQNSHWQNNSKLLAEPFGIIFSVFLTW